MRVFGLLIPLSQCGRAVWLRRIVLLLVTNGLAASSPLLREHVSELAQVRRQTRQLELADEPSQLAILMSQIEWSQAELARYPALRSLCKK